jgi:K+-transporting ATPase A subunit
MLSFNLDQAKHLAGVLDKVAIAYFAVVGYTSYSQRDWLVFVHAVLAFAVIESLALWALSSGAKPVQVEKQHVD